MKEEKISGRQFGILTFVMMLSPVIHAIPSRVASAGNAGWLVTIPAVLPLAFLLYGIGRCLERLPDGCGLGDIYLTAFGRPWGRICCGVNLLWVLMLLLVDLRFYAERYVATVYPETGLFLFYLAMVLLQVWIAKGDFGSFVRTGKILFWVVAAALITVLAMSVNMVKLYNVWPVWDTSLKEVGKSIYRLSTVMTFAIPASFMIGRVDWRTSKKGGNWWMLLLTGTVMLLAWIIIGVYGGELAQRLQVPFFNLAKEVSFRGAVEGLEIIVAAMWVMADTAMIGMQIFAAGEIVQCAAPVQRPDLFRVGMVCLLLPLCYLLPESAFQMDTDYQMYGMKVSIMVGYLLPGAALLVGKIRRKW